jgi:predicted GIY-YIG superfamily endonuclease
MTLPGASTNIRRKPFQASLRATIFQSLFGTKLVWYEEHSEIDDAIAREKSLNAVA